jgi:outer membrane protein assembly factor BamB
MRITIRPIACVGAAMLMAIAPIMPPRGCWFASAQHRDNNAARSWPMFGGSPARNMVGADQELPDDWSVREGKLKNVRWSADLGSQSVGSPVVANGKVFVVTNNAMPRDPRERGQKAVLMAFRESDGRFLWQIAHDFPFLSTRGSTGVLMSTPVVSDGNLYYVTSAGEVVCADADDGKVLWRYDMHKELHVHPYQGWCPAVAASCPSPLVVGNLLFTATGNGIDAEGNLVAPKAPSFIALDAGTGRLVWQSKLGSENTIEAHRSSPALAVAGGRRQVLFAGGDGVIYSFAPATGALLWQCDCLPARKKKGDPDIDNQFVGSPVVVGDRLYVGMGIAPDNPQVPRWSYFLCLDLTRQGDVSLRNYDAKSAENKESALVWAFGGPIEPRPRRGPRANFGSTLSTAAVHDGLVYITETAGYLHCLNAASGSRIWVYDLAAQLFGSPYLVRDRLYLGTDNGEILTFAHRRAARLLGTIDMDDAILTTPVAVGGTLYIATRTRLYAIGSH